MEEKQYRVRVVDRETGDVLVVFVRETHPDQAQVKALHLVFSHMNRRSLTAHQAQEHHGEAA